MKTATKHAQKSTAQKNSNKKPKSKLAFEPFFWQELAPTPIIGVDEVGRGCLAGRVYAAAVVLPSIFEVLGVTDSKLISEIRREEISLQIWGCAKVSLGFAEVEEIDSINILQASLLAMKRAIQGLGFLSGHVIIDGNQRIKELRTEFPGLTQTTVVKGDLRALPISAASIVAKVARDREMKALAETFPEYGFEKHKGYASELHREAIRKHGPCPHHRKSFAGVKEYL